MVGTEPVRHSSFGASQKPTAVDRFGIWLSSRSIRKSVGSFAGKRVADFGCGFNATFVRSVLDEVASAVVVDVALSDDLGHHRLVTAVEGVLPGVLAGIPSGSLDVAMCISSLEHVAEPDALLGECRRLLAPGGLLLVNVPSWWGKRFLEFSAFRLGLSPAEEMDDHKMYYDPKDLWPLLRRAGFLPHNIRCRRYKAGLNVFAECRVDSPQP